MWRAVVSASDAGGGALTVTTVDGAAATITQWEADALAWDAGGVAVSEASGRMATVEAL